MNVYMISYPCDISNMKDIENEIKKCKSWWNYIDFNWIVLTNENVNDIWNRFEPIIDKTKHFLIIEVNPINLQGWLKQEEWDYINNTLRRK